jgi:hypothetical protein
MKKITLSCLLMILSFSFSYGCDICGCGLGNNYLGILPEFQQHIIGFRFRYNSLRTHLGVGGTTSYLTNTESYATGELWGGWNLHQNLRLMFNVPYSFNTRENTTTHIQKNGLGDMSVQLYYALIQQRKTLHHHLFEQSLWVGAGIKLPTGQYNPADKNSSTQSTNLFQLGTGSTDFTMNIMYDARLEDAGINISATYKINTTNTYGYRYGNKFSTTAQLYYKFRIANSLTLATNTGIQYENCSLDTDQNFTVDVSGGKLLLGTVGAEANIKKIALGANWQTPLTQNLANGFVKANNRIMVHVAFIF